MRGAIIGDIAGSIFENVYTCIELKELFEPRSRFTDDTVCTVAIADAIIMDKPFSVSLREWGLKYPDVGYGGMFQKWLKRQIRDGYGSYANGAPMRVSACGWLAGSEDEALRLSDSSCMPTHNHIDAITAARAVTRAIIAGRSTGSKEAVLHEITATLDAEIPTTEEILGRKIFDVSAKGTVLTAAACLRETSTFEEAIRLAVYLGGDADTNAAICGSVAESYLEIPRDIWQQAKTKLTPEIISVVDAFDDCLLHGRPKRSFLQNIRGLFKI